MQTIAIAVSASAAGCLGWYCRASTRVTNLVRAAGGHRQVHEDRLSCSRWALAAGLATGGVVASQSGRGPGALPPLVVSSLAVWAGALAILALIDQESLVLPTKLVRAALIVATGLLAAGTLGAAQRHYLWQGATTACVAGVFFAAWAAVNPRGLGFGDARMACLVGVGAGVLSFSGAPVALSCSALVAGLVGRYRLRHSLGPEGAAVALGPFLAVGGYMVVMARAF